MKTQGKCKICHITVHENVFQGTFLSRVSQGKVKKYPGNLRENSGNLVSQKCGHPVLEIGVLMRLDISRNDSTIPLSHKLVCVGAKCLGILWVTFCSDLGNDVFADLEILHLQFISLP